jgi:hypothetical protein
MNASTQSGSLILGNSGNTVTIELNRPLTPGYDVSALTSWNQIGYRVRNRTTNNTCTTTFRAFSPINGLVVGRYFITINLYTWGSTSTMVFSMSYVDSANAITNGQIGGFTYFFDDGFNVETQKPQQNNHFSQNISGIIDVRAGFLNIALGCCSNFGTSAADCIFTVVLTRIA